MNEDYYGIIHEWQQENGGLVLNQISKFVRVEANILERISSKCIEDSSLQEMINDGPEPFSIYDRVDTVDSATDIFTTLPAGSLFEQHDQASSPNSAILAKSSATLISGLPIGPSTGKDEEGPEASPRSDTSPPTLETEGDSSLLPRVLYTWVGEFHPGAGLGKDVSENASTPAIQAKKPSAPPIHLYDLTSPTSHNVK